MYKSNGYSARRIQTLPLLFFMVSSIGLQVGCSGSGGEFVETPTVDENKTGLIVFNQCDELLSYFHDEAVFTLSHVQESMDFSEPDIALGVSEGANSDANGPVNNNGAMDRGAAPSFSTTNVQERAVDEPDIAKTDGDYIYTVAGGWLLIHNADDLTELSQTEILGGDAQLLLEGDSLAVVGRHYGAPEEAFELDLDERRIRNHKTVISVYNIADRENPALVRRSLLRVVC